MAERRPLVLVLEDMHWADRSTRELIALLARQQHGDIVIAMSVRTDESQVPPGLAGYLADSVRYTDHRLVIDPLSREEQARQLSDILGVPPPTQLVDEIYARAEGNPFFAEEVIVNSGPGDPPCVAEPTLLRQR
jgi:predicted ATPase